MNFLTKAFFVNINVSEFVQHTSDHHKKHRQPPMYSFYPRMDRSNPYVRTPKTNKKPVTEPT